MLAWVVVAVALLLAAGGLVVLAWDEPAPPPWPIPFAPAPTVLPPVAADELRGITVPGAGRGYDRLAVDVLLERAAATIEALAAQVPDAATTPVTAATSAPESGEELEDGGGDGTGVLDR